MKGVHVLMKQLVTRELLTKYAELVVRVGVNVQKGQPVVINCPIESFTFAHIVQKVAYDLGASNVIMNWIDDETKKEFYLRASDEAIDTVPDSMAARYEEWDMAGAAYIHIITENPDLFKDVCPDRIKRFSKIMYSKLNAHYENKRSYRNRWSIIAVPSKSWAMKLFPHLPECEAIETLWHLILKGARADGENPIADWEAHGKSFKSRVKFLNDNQFNILHFTNSLGTDLKVGLPKNHRYIGGGVKDKNGIVFFPNIPTEEIFTSPHKNNVNGVMMASKPLIYAENIIENLKLVFKDGEIVDYKASTGQDVLKTLIDFDEGSRYLGEIALASNISPLSQTETLFYNTLFDENTGCHIGIGNANPSNIQNGDRLTKEELQTAGLNSSLVLVNAAFGTSDMKVVGIKKDNSKFIIINNGEFQI